MAHLLARGFSCEGFHVNIKCLLIFPHYITLAIFVLTIRGIFVILPINENWVKSDKIYSPPSRLILNTPYLFHAIQALSWIWQMYDFILPFQEA